MLKYIKITNLKTSDYIIKQLYNTASLALFCSSPNTIRDVEDLIDKVVEPKINESQLLMERDKSKVIKRVVKNYFDVYLN